MTTQRLVRTDRLEPSAGQFLPSAGSRTLSLAVGVVLGAAIPLGIVFSADRYLWSTAVITQLLLICYIGMRLAAQLCTPTIRPTVGVFWVFSYVALGLVPLAQLVTRHGLVLMDTDQDGALIKADVVVVVGMVAFDLVGWLAGRNGPRRPGTRLPRVLDERRLRYTSAAAVGMTLLYVASAGPSSFFASREKFFKSFSGASSADSGQTVLGLISSFGSVPVLVCLVGWTVVLKRKGVKRFYLRPIWVLLFALNVVVNNPISNARYWFLCVGFALAVTVWAVGVRTFRALLILGVLLAVVVFPYSDYFRYDSADREPVAAHSVLETLATKDYDQMTMIANGVTSVERFGYGMGAQLAGAVFFWVPRNVWHDKALDTGTVVAEHMRSTNLNLSSPLWIEFWLDLGWPGLLIGFALFGFWATRLDAAFHRHYITRQVGSGPAAVLIGVPLLAGFEFILLRGPLLQAMGRLSVIALTLVVVSVAGVRANTGPAPRDRQRAA